MSNGDTNNVDIVCVYRYRHNTHTHAQHAAEIHETFPERLFILVLQAGEAPLKGGGKKAPPPVSHPQTPPTKLRPIDPSSDQSAERGSKPGWWARVKDADRRGNVATIASRLHATHLLSHTDPPGSHHQTASRFIYFFLFSPDLICISAYVKREREISLLFQLKAYEGGNTTLSCWS